MIWLAVCWAVSIIACFAVIVFFVERADQLKIELGNTQAALEHAKEKSAEKDNRIDELAVGGCRILQEKAAERIRLYHLMARYRFLTASIGFSYLKCLEDNWKAQDAQSRAYWLKRGTEIIDADADADISKIDLNYTAPPGSNQKGKAA